MAVNLVSPKHGEIIKPKPPYRENSRAGGGASRIRASAPTCGRFSRRRVDWAARIVSSIESFFASMIARRALRVADSFANPSIRGVSELAYSNIGRFDDAVTHGYAQSRIRRYSPRFGNLSETYRSLDWSAISELRRKKPRCAKAGEYVPH